jgi:hypothetical protein
VGIYIFIYFYNFLQQIHILTAGSGSFSLKFFLKGGPFSEGEIEKQGAKPFFTAQWIYISAGGG